MSDLEKELEALAGEHSQVASMLLDEADKAFRFGEPGTGEAKREDADFHQRTTSTIKRALAALRESRRDTQMLSELERWFGDVTVYPPDVRADVEPLFRDVHWVVTRAGQEYEGATLREAIENAMKETEASNG